MKKCPFCNIEMIKLQNSEVPAGNIKLQEGDLYYSPSDKNIRAMGYLCSKCGLVLHYLDEEYLKYFQ